MGNKPSEITIDDVAWLKQRVPYGELQLKQEAGCITRVIAIRNWTKQDIEKERECQRSSIS